MSRISVDMFVHGLYGICAKNPTYKNGHDGSDGSCDGIGFIRGGLLCGGATKITNMREPNQFARKVAVNLRKIDLELKRGDVLLKTKDINDNSMPLPSKYRFGGSDFNGDLVNYTDIGVITKEKPFTILWMTHKGIVKSNDAKDWDYVCSLPYIMEEEEKIMSSAMVFTDKGSSVKLYAKPSFSCDDVINLPNETLIMVAEKGKAWTKVLFGDKEGYVLSNFIKESNKETNIAELDIEEIRKAYIILGKVLGYIK